MRVRLSGHILAAFCGLWWFVRGPHIHTVLPADLVAVKPSDVSAGDEVGIDGGRDADVDVRHGDAPVSKLCGTEVCAEGQTCCGYVCVDAASDPSNCGGCGNVCGASETCADGVCLCGDLACADQATCCDDGGVLTCVTTANNRSHCGGCGNTCDTSEVCASGHCACVAYDGVAEICEADEVCCSGIGCENLDEDPTSCGACGLFCGPGELCNAGYCECGELSWRGDTACPVDTVCCGSPAQCRELDDPACDCGTRLCGSGELCCEGEVAGAPADVCTPLATDEDNCGACGVSCGPSQRCHGGTCVCETGLGDCDGDPNNGCETGLLDDHAHCGSCETACVPGDVCD